MRGAEEAGAVIRRDFLLGERSTITEHINLRSLDSLRGLPATYVVLGHARRLLWEGQDAWRKTPHGIFSQSLEIASGARRYGHEAVMVFFALSASATWAPLPPSFK